MRGQEGTTLCWKLRLMKTCVCGRETGIKFSFALCPLKKRTPYVGGFLTCSVVPCSFFEALKQHYDISLFSSKRKSKQWSRHWVKFILYDSGDISSYCVVCLSAASDIGNNVSLPRESAGPKDETVFALAACLEAYTWFLAACVAYFFLRLYVPVYRWCASVTRNIIFILGNWCIYILPLNHFHSHSPSSCACPPSPHPLPSHRIYLPLSYCLSFLLFKLFVFWIFI